MPEVRIAGHTWYYERHGQGTPLLMLHGALGTGTSEFRYQLEPFAARHEIIVPDLPGYGRSSPRLEFTADFYEEDARDVATLIERVIGQPTHLYGFSDGGMVALLVAARWPHLVRSLVLESAQAVIDEQTMRAVRAWLPLDELPESWRRSLARNHGEPYWRLLVQRYIEGQERVFARGGDVCSAALEAIRCPTLLIHGDQDPFVGLQHGHMLHQRIAGSELVVFERTGHSVHREHVETFNKLVLDFLARVNGAPGR